MGDLYGGSKKHFFYFPGKGDIRMGLKMSDNPCLYCMNRNKIKKAGYELMQKIEELPPSDLQTEIVVMAGAYVELANKEADNLMDCQNSECELHPGIDRDG